MTTYRIPARAGPATGATAGAERWLFGLAASYEAWPQAEYEFREPVCGLPVYADHRQDMITGWGLVSADVGAARRIAEVEGLGLACLIEITSPVIVWDVTEGKRCGLSVKMALDEPPGYGKTWLCPVEVSLTDHPADPKARVISSGRLALRDWRDLTGEPVPVLAGGDE